jgi:hypothetical protein
MNIAMSPLNISQPKEAESVSHILNWAKKNFIGTLIESNGYRLHHCEFSRTGEYFLLPTTRDHASTGSLEGNKLSPGGDTMKPIGDS